MEANKESPSAFKTPCKPAKVKSPGKVIFKRLILYNASNVNLANVTR